MQTFISFLRGVNMTGHNSIRMTELAALYEDLGFGSPQTYIQSGNVIFGNGTDKGQSETASKIEKGIYDRFGFDVPTMVRSIPELREIMKVNPYLNEMNFDPAKMAVIFLYEQPTPDQLRKLEGIDYPPDKFTVIGKEIYTYCPNGFGRTKIYTNFFENKMKVKGTARNLKTVVTLTDMAEKRK
jgi:uncharacterized protein (DUF1697 family)